MSIEANFNIAFVAELALREKQIQQNYRPIIAVHKWFARRPGTLFRALTLAEFGDAPVEDLFFRANDFPGKRVADPFMGGGTPLIEANRVGCDVLGCDINPMSAWIVREEIEHLDLIAYRAAADALLAALRADLDALYRTDCPIYGDKDVPAKTFLWVKEIDCASCGTAVPLFPGYLLAEDARHPANVLVCGCCGQLNETTDLAQPGACRDCRARLNVDGPARRNRCACPSCGHVNSYPRPETGPPRHRLFAIEYYNPARKAGHKGRFFKKPDASDLARFAEAERRWQALEPLFVPEQPILPGDETDRLHRWGYERYADLFNSRQLLGLEHSARLIAAVQDKRVRHALATNLSDLLRYQNMLCRYDTMALKTLDVFSVHGFPAGLVQAESNLLGIVNGTGTNVGSGGWTNIIEKYTRAKRYCDAPFEVRKEGSRKVQIPIEGEWIGERLNGHRRRDIAIRCASSDRLNLEPASLDAVFTDPPYFGNVQYGELMDFCYVWLRRLLGEEAEGFARASSRDADELTVNQTEGRGLNHFTEGLAAVYATMARALKPGAPLAFTYHHNKLQAYQSVAVAILDAGLTCSAALPCPAEMGGSIHIHGTGSSIVDTVFVCRSTGATARQGLCETADQLAALVADELHQLRDAGMKPTAGDVRCIVFGHVTRLAVWTLSPAWDASLPTRDKLAQAAQAMTAFGDLAALTEHCRTLTAPDPKPGACSRPPDVLRGAGMPLPFEVSYAEVQANVDSFVEEVFASLQSGFMTLPKGPGFIEYATFEGGYEALKRTTRGFRDMAPEPVLALVWQTPITLIVLRAMLGFTPSEWADAASARTDTDVSQGAARSIDRKVRIAPETPLRETGVSAERIRALVVTGCQLLTDGPEVVEEGFIHRLYKADTSGGLTSIAPLADIGVPYAMLLYERFLGRPFAGHRDSVSELVGDILETAIEELLTRHGISYRKTKRAERVQGFEQAPDFIIPNEFNPQVIIEAKIAEDDGTARDKVTRVQHLHTLSMRGRTEEQGPAYEVVACIAGRGFKQRKQDMRKLIEATGGKVFTLQTLSYLVEHTRLKMFETKQVPKGPKPLGFARK